MGQAYWPIDKWHFPGNGQTSLHLHRTHFNGAHAWPDTSQQLL